MKYFADSKKGSNFVPAIEKTSSFCATVAQLVERDLAKVEVAGSNPVFRSAKKAPQVGAFFVACPGGGMVDTKDLKSFGQKCPCEFESRFEHIILC